MLSLYQSKFLLRHDSPPGRVVVTQACGHIYHHWAAHLHVRRVVNVALCMSLSFKKSGIGRTEKFVIYFGKKYNQNIYDSE